MSFFRIDFIHFKITCLTQIISVILEGSSWYRQCLGPFSYSVNILIKNRKDTCLHLERAAFYENPRVFAVYTLDTSSPHRDDKFLKAAIRLNQDGESRDGRPLSWFTSTCNSGTKEHYSPKRLKSARKVKQFDLYILMHMETCLILNLLTIKYNLSLSSH